MVRSHAAVAGSLTHIFSRAVFRAEEVHQRRERNWLQRPLHSSSSYVGTGFIGGEDQGLHRLSVGAGPATHGVQDWRNGDLAKSRRHLECRSFKPRTTDHYTQVDCSPCGTLFPALAAYICSCRFGKSEAKMQAVLPDSLPYRKKPVPKIRRTSQSQKKFRLLQQPNNFHCILCARRGERRDAQARKEKKQWPA